MLSLLMTTLKITAFSVLVLVLGQVVEWKGKSVSDQIKSGLSSTRFEIPKQDLSNMSFGKQLRAPKSTTSAPEAPIEGISESERQKLRRLIQDLNSP